MREEEGDAAEISDFFDRFMTINALDRTTIADNAGALVREAEKEDEETPAAAAPEATAAEDEAEGEG